MKDTESATTSRRGFLEKIFAATVVVVATPSVVLGRIVPTLRPTAQGLAGRFRIDLNDQRYATLRNVGGSVKLQSMAGVGFRVIVTRTAQNVFAAVDATCTHEGCVVTEVRASSGGHIVCGCHGSRFLPDGTVVQGPAREPLRRLDTVYDGGSIVEVEIDGLASSPDERSIGAHVGTPFVDGDRATLDIALEGASEVEAGVYSPRGELLVPAFDGRLGAGEHELRASIAGLPAGAYIFRLRLGRSIISRKFVVAR